MPPQPRLPRLVLTKIGSNDFNHLTHHLRTISLFCTLQIAVSHQNNLFPINSNNTMQDIMVLKIGTILSIIIIALLLYYNTRKPLRH